jgi:hypothetical protein
MKKWIAALAILATAPFAVTAQEAPRSRAEIADNFVQSVFAMPMGLWLSFTEHQGRLLGDSVAAAVARQLRLVELLDSEKANRVLNALSYAFEEPQFIQVDEDRKPGVTLLLLDHLANYSPDSVVRERAAALTAKIAPKPN